MWSRVFLFLFALSGSFAEAALRPDQIAALGCRETLLVKADREPYSYLFNSEEDARRWEDLIQQEATLAARGGPFGVSAHPFDIHKQRLLAEVISPNSQDAQWMNQLGFRYIAADGRASAAWEYSGNLGNLPIRIQETLVDQAQKAGLQSMDQMIFLGMMFGDEFDFGRFKDLVALAPFVDQPPNRLFSSTFQNAAMANQISVWDWASFMARGRMPFSLHMSYHDLFHFFDYFREPALMAADRRLFKAIDNRKLVLREGKVPKLGATEAGDVRAYHRVHTAREYFSLPNPRYAPAKDLFASIPGKTVKSVNRELSKLSLNDLRNRLNQWLSLDPDAFVNYGAASRDVNCALRQNHRNLVLDLLRDFPNERWATAYRQDWAQSISGAESYLLLHSGQIKALRILAIGVDQPDQLKEWIRSAVLAASTELSQNDLDFLTSNDQLKRWIVHRLARLEASVSAALDLNFTIYDLISDIARNPDSFSNYYLSSKTGRYFAAFAKGTYYETIFLENR